MYKGRFKKSKALGVVVDLRAVFAAVKIRTWALQEALGAQETLYTKPAYQSNAPGARAAGSQPQQGLLLLGKAAQLLQIAVSQHGAHEVAVSQHGAQPLEGCSVRHWLSGVQLCLLPWF